MTSKDNRPEQVAPSTDVTGSPQADKLQLDSAQKEQTFRWLAEEVLRRKVITTPENLESLSSEEKRRLFHEMGVHQIELEMQNEELRRAQIELDVLRAKYYDLYDLAPVGYCTVSEPGLILEANLTAGTLFGVDRNALIKQPLTRFIIKEDQDIYYRHRKLLFESCEPQECELRMMNNDGTAFWARLEATAVQDTDGALLSRVVLSDATEQKQAEGPLKSSLSLLSAALESTADGLLIVNSEGRVAQYNQKFAEMWKIPEDVLASYDDDILLDYVMTQLADSGQFLAKVREMYAQPEQSSFDQIDFLDGRVFERYSQPQKIETTVVGRVWSFRDITERKQAEEEKAKLEEQNRQLKKAESLGCMAGAIAHQFNNKLGVVIGNLEMALDDVPRGVGAAYYLTAAMQGALEAAEISGKMLTYLGQTVGRFEALDLSETCRQSLPHLMAAAPKDIILNADLPSPGPTINASTTQIQQVLKNLATNAWEAADEKQKGIDLIVKKVSLADIPTTHRFPVDWQPQDAAYACLEVRDSGSGIADEDIDKLFDPFFSKKFSGRGLGLPVALGIVKTHGGAIAVESETGRGSCFRVFLPMSKGFARRRQDKTPQPLVREEGGTVLLVDDEEMLRNMAKAMLMRFGYTVLTAEDGVEAVEVFEKHADEICLILCDLTMPRMNGWETLSALRQIRPNIPVILASGYDKTQVIAGDHTELPQAFLHKPYQLAELKDALAKTMGW